MSMGDMIDSRWRDTCLCVAWWAWLMRLSDRTDDSCGCGCGCVCEWERERRCEWHDSYLWGTWLINSQTWLTWLIRHVAYVYTNGHNSFIWVMRLMSTTAVGWLWLVGSIKLQVSFAKEPYKRDDILQKRPIILSILLTVATPYKGHDWFIHGHDWHDSYVVLRTYTHTEMTLSHEWL